MNFKRILVFAAHSDDEIIGPGGTIAKFAGQKSLVNLVVFTSGDTAYTNINEKNKITAIRKDENKQSCRILGIRNKIDLNLPCQGLVNNRELYQKCVGIIRDFKPDLILTHYGRDKHRDHRVVSEVTEEARWKASENVLADLGKPWYCDHLFFYEICELFTSPSIVIDITKTYRKKIEAMKSQKSQLKVLPGMLDYLEGLAKTRGYLCGKKYAECFLRSNFIPSRIK